MNQRRTAPTLGSPGAEDVPSVLRASSRVGGRYELITCVGRGGHGEVWEASDPLTSQRVAVKLFRSGDHGQAARVRREIAVLRMLRLPGVVAMLDEGSESGAPYMVMELVDGDPFPAKGLPVPWEQLSDCVERLLEVVGRIHAAGVIHRDLKPSNVLVAPDGRVTVLDFGLSFPQTSSSDRLTADFEFMGTPAYLAPEQLTGEAVGPETDLYAIGVMLYEALTGTLPHHGSGIRGLLADRLTRKPKPIGECVPSLPASVQSVVMHLLEIDQNARPLSAEAVLRRLRDRWEPELRSLGRLGSSEPVVSIVRAHAARESLDVWGPHGSGRSRLLADAAARLRAEGVTVLEATASAAPLASARSLLPAEEEPTADASLDGAIRRVTDALRARLRSGAAIFVDDADRCDALSARVFASVLGDGLLVRVFNAAPRARAPRAVELEPLGPTDIEPLFEGPERLLRLKSDAAQQLFERSDGWPRAVLEELEAWVRAGFCRWAERAVVIDRAALDRIALDPRPIRTRGPARPARAPSDASLPTHLSMVAQWLDLAGANASTTVLVELTGEPRWQVEAELDELEQRGLVRRANDGTPVIATREAAESVFESRSAAHRALARALPRGRPGRILHLLASGANEDPATAEELVREALLRSDDLARDGRLGPAMVLLSDAIRALRPLIDGRTLDPRPLLSAWVELAIIANSPAALDGVLYEITRAGASGPQMTALEQLVGAALAVSVWDARAANLVEALEPFEDVRLELARCAVRVLAARRVSLESEERRIDEILARFADERAPFVRARCAQWVARLEYRRGHFSRAARLHGEASELEPWLSLRTVALLDAASAHMEAFELAEAEVFAARAKELAVTSRNALLEGRTEWLSRAIAFRSGRSLPVDHALVDAIGQLGSKQLEALVSLGEAAFAFRAGDLGLAATLAERAYALWSSVGEAIGSLVAAALAVRCGRALASDVVRSVYERALACPIPGVGIQALALLAASGVVKSPPRAALHKLVEGVAREHWSKTMELLSVNEALAMLDAAPGLLTDPPSNRSQ
ncbi:MAG: serine/threonine protein kinase [Myxococcales bacterium]|nr:serine/threonine protein kinase [Myxococcales bacterium]